MQNIIQVYEHEKLKIGVNGFDKEHWNALIKLNELNDNKYFNIEHNGIRFNQYVGIVQIQGLTIEILPKVDREESNTNWRGVLIAMLKTCKRLSADSYSDARVRRQNLNLLDLYFEYFLSEVDTLIHRGLVKKYRSENKNVKALKGRFIFQEHIQRNLIHKERFYTSHQVYDTDHKLHRILNETLFIIERCTNGTYIFDRCKRTQLCFPELSRTRIDLQFLDSVLLNRKTESYKRALELARFIILNYSADIAGGKENMISLLFNMNDLWEEYIYRVLHRESLNYHSVKVQVQKIKTFWSAENAHIKKTVRPDILIEIDGKRYIIDTKWKLPKNLRPDDNDLKQIYVYNLLWKAEKSILLYPKPKSVQPEKIKGKYNHGLSDLNHGHTGEMHFYDIINDNGRLDKDIGTRIMESIMKRI